MGYGDATAELFEVYLNGFRTFADQEVIVEANEEKAVEYAKNMLKEVTYDGKALRK